MEGERILALLVLPLEVSLVHEGGGDWGLDGRCLDGEGGGGRQSDGPSVAAVRGIQFYSLISSSDVSE